MAHIRRTNTKKLCLYFFTFLKKLLQKRFSYAIISFVVFADVMELADVTDSKSVGGNTVWVRLPPSAPRKGRHSNGVAFLFLLFQN